MRVTRFGLPTGTVTFLFSDIEGSTRLVQALGPEVFRTVLEQHNAILREAFDGHGGMERGTQGDSFTVIFQETPPAVAAAVAAQRSIAAAGWSDGVDVRVRIGLHTGVGLAGGDDYIGVDINRAARIAAAAYGGQTLVSEATHALVARDLPTGTFVRDRGHHRLRDLAEPEHLYEIAIEGLTPEFPPPRAESVVGNLPGRLTSFVGREAELADLAGLLDEARLLTITGPGGIGKTSLAIEFARRIADRFADGAWLVRLESVGDRALIWPAIADALGVRDTGSRRSEDLLIHHLAGRRILLVVDNLEHLGTGAPVAGLLEASPDLRVVATSRAPLHVTAEQVFPLGPLPIGSADGDVNVDDAVRLFVERARRVVPGFRPEADEARAVVEICRRLDGLPLGIELAAARVRLLPPRAILERLERRLDLPGQAAADLPARQRTLDDAIAWSHDLLEPAARRLLARLSAFSGGARLAEIERVAGADLGIEPIDGLAVLVDQSLVTPAAGVDGPRYRMLETIRSYAADRLAESGETPTIRRGHALGYLDLAEAEAAHLPGRGQAVRLARLTEDHDNLRIAIDWAIEAGDADVGLRFAAAMWRFWQFRGHVVEGRDLVGAMLAIPGAARDDVLRMRAVEAAGGLAYWHGDHDTAQALYEEQVRIARAIGDRRGEADGHFNLSFIRSPAAIANLAAELDHAAALYREVGDERGSARVDWARTQRPMAVGVLEDVGLAIDNLRSGLHRFEELDDTMWVQMSSGSLGWAHLARGDVAEAAPWGPRALRLARKSGGISGAVFELRAVPIAVAAYGRLVEAATLLGAFVQLRQLYGVQPPLVLERLVARSDTMELVRSQLEPATFEAAYRAGGEFTIDEAVDYALRVLESLAVPARPG